eukprot:2377243-Amphidinium_carterae.2
MPIRDKKPRLGSSAERGLHQVSSSKHDADIGANRPLAIPSNLGSPTVAKFLDSGRLCTLLCSAGKRLLHDGRQPVCF